MKINYAYLALTSFVLAYLLYRTATNWSPGQGKSRSSLTGGSNNGIPERFLSKEKNLSPHDFKWKVQPDNKCGYEDTVLLVMIASAVAEVDRRHIIRETWASYDRGRKIKHLFFVADDDNTLHLDAVMRESDKFDDIVMEDFRDSYRNLTLKTQGQLKWATELCPDVEYVMHVDDDVIVDVAAVIRWLDARKSHKRLLGCSRIFEPVVRREGKWKMPVEDYPHKYYPKSCIGWCFAMTKEVAREIYLMSLDTHLIHLEDVTFTGILREKVGNIHMEEMRAGQDRELCQHLGWPKDKPTNVKIIRAWSKMNGAK